MQIDWFTLGAQAFNLVLLAFLLWRVLYRPVRGAVERREERIRSHMEEAVEKMEEAESEREEYQRRKEELEGKSDELLAEAERAADERRDELRAEIQEDMDRLRKEWRDSVRKEMDDFLEELSGRSRDQLFDLLRRALGDLVETQPGEAVTRAFVASLEDAPDDEVEAFTDALVEADGVCRISTSLDLPDEGLSRVREVLKGWLPEGRELDLRVESDDDGPRGIELWAGDRKMAWTVEAYVEELRSSAEDILRAEAGEDDEDYEPEPASDRSASGASESA